MIKIQKLCIVFYDTWDGCMSVSPYYIVDKNGKPEIGVYKKNYEP